MDSFLRSLCEKLKIPFKGFKTLTGGDINDVFLLQSGSKQWVIKINDALSFPGMFEAEARGLSLLENSESFRIPEIKEVGVYDGKAYLIMEYLPSKAPDANIWERFAVNLANLHQISNPNFGLDHNNYIGSLPQYNTIKESAFNFYVEQRLEPQFRWAREKGYSFHQEPLFKNLENEIPEEPPALIHGDLWFGNFMVIEGGVPVLIDPAVAFAPREMDLGMMQLFGGFPDRIFSMYHELFPLVPGWEHRIPIWQLYYLLVHLNIFGGNYYGQVKNLVDKFS